MLGNDVVYILAGQSNANAMSRTTALREAGLITVIEGGTSLSPSEDGNDWYPIDDGDAATGELFDRLKSTIDRATADGSIFGGIIWVQGEADTRDTDDAAQYGALLDMMFSELTDEFGTGWNMVVSMLAEDAPNDRKGWDTVRAAQEEFIADNDRVIGIDPGDVARTLGLTPEDAFRDHLHYTTPLQEGIFFAAMEAMAGYDGPLITGSNAHESIVGTVRHDLIAGMNGADKIRGRGGDDVIAGGRGNDRLVGGAGDDDIAGNLGYDHLFGGDGRDRIHGGAGDDRVAGGAGRDWLAGGTGDDQLWGGRSADIFVFGDGDGRDMVHDFLAGHDRLVINGEIDEIRQVGNGARIIMSDHSDVLILRGVHVSELDGLL